MLTIGPPASTIDMTMESAIYKALFDVKTQAIFDCPSNCIRNETYISLGFAANCSDVTAATQATAQDPTQAQKNQSKNWYNMTTPGNISINAGFSVTSWLTLANVVAVDLLSKYHSSTPTSPIPISADFARIAILTASVDNVDTADDDCYPGEWKIEECTIGLTAYQYLNVSASGTNFDLNNRTSAIPLTSGFLNDTILTFNQSGIPTMMAQGIDLVAINNFLTSSSFSGYIFSGEEPPNSSTGVGNVMRNADIPIRLTTWPLA
jgi:hypothetical protein